ncbi:MAG: hypothetical protein GTO24_11145 [candidate division Zixibacteria bacterium]|nr:hypothetical protein [candidate division Zixibacteria bacterium]
MVLRERLGLGLQVEIEKGEGHITEKVIITGTIILVELSGRFGHGYDSYLSTKQGSLDGN